MNKDEVKNAMARIVEDTDISTSCQMLELLRNFSRCSEHGKNQICDEVYRITGEDTNEAILVTFPPKYCGEDEDLVEEIAKRDREETLIENMLTALKIENSRGR